jgi:hypothetical protein
MVPRSRLRVSSRSGLRPCGARVLRAWLTVLTAVALLSATLLAGNRYFYCAAMQTSLARSCCHEAPRDGEGAHVDRADCCESRVIASLPSAEQREAAPVPGAPLAVLFVAARQPRTALAPLPEPPLERARWGREPPDKRQVQARVMVFLI